MSKKVPPPPSQPAGSFWLPFAFIGLIGALLGATLTYLALRPGLATTPAGTAPGASPDPSTHLPAPDLTAGKTPAEADRALGNFHYDHQNWPQAIARYESAIRLGSDDADIRTDLGNAYRFAGRTDDALAQYTRAQLMNPSHEFSLFNQGGLYLEDLKQPAKAIEVWQEYLNRFPAGRNIAAARQLIAQAQTGTSGLALPAASGGTGQPSSTDLLILQQIQAGQKQTGKP